MTTYYIRDAQGNLMATYQAKPLMNSLRLQERPIYGSDRLGMDQTSLELGGLGTLDLNGTVPSTGYDGNRRFELKDHLGNVRVTITGDRYGVDQVPQDGFVDYSVPKIVGWAGYEPFGSLLPGRNYSAQGDGYRFGFNGQEKDDEVFGSIGTSMSAQFWQYDTRTGRRWNLDPVDQISVSDYATFRNNPLYYNDPEGDCPLCITAGIGAGLGFLIGGAIEIGVQLYHDGSVSDWQAVGGSAVQAGIAGGVIGLTGGTSLLATAAAGGAGNALGGAVNQGIIQGKPVTVHSVATDATVGIVAGGVFHIGGKILGNFLRSSVGQTMSARVANLAKSQKIFSNAKSLDPKNGKAIVEKYFNQMKSGTYKETGGAGFIDKAGNVILTEGNHRMNAALQYAVETGDNKFVEGIINRGNFIRNVDPKTYGVSTRDLPTLPE